MRKHSILLVMVILVLLWAYHGPVYPEEEKIRQSPQSRNVTEAAVQALPVAKQEKDRVKVSVEHHHIYAADSLEGKGQKNATSFDTSIYEASLFKSQQFANGSLITTNSRYPMTSSSAFTSNTWFDIKALCEDNLAFGGKLSLYTMSDSDYDASSPGTKAWRTARVFGVMMPTGSFNGLVPGNPALPGSPVPSLGFSLWNTFLEGKGERSKWKVEAGNLYPSMGKSYNKYLNMQHFLFRTPVSQMSILGHWIRQDRIFSEAEPLIRMPGWGFKGAGEAGDFNGEFFSLKNYETPITPGREYRYGGGRLGYATKKLRLAATRIDSLEHLLLTLPASNRSETITSWEGEYELSSQLALYGAAASTRFLSDGIRSGAVFNGCASVYGIYGTFLEKRLTLDLRYQYCDPNYEPLNHHKRTMYPTGYEGMRCEARYFWGREDERKKNKNSVAVHWYSYRQVNPNVNVEPGYGMDLYAAPDYVFPQGGSPSGPNLTAGTITVFSPEFTVKFWNLPVEIGAYYEKLSFDRGLDALGHCYHKNVDNLSLWMDYELTRTMEFVAGYREVDYEGEWFFRDNPCHFKGRTRIPKIGLVFDNDHDLKITAMLHHYTFNDLSPLSSPSAAPSDNDWSAKLFMLETMVSF